MSDGVELRPLAAGEEDAICELVRRVFDETVAPDLAADGIAQFYRYADAAAMAERLAADHLVVVAELDGRAVGVVEVRRGRHVSMLFVDGAARGSGIGRALLGRALAICRATSPQPAEVTVNSGPGAVGFYRRIGFRPTGPEQTVDGIRFVPMAAPLGGIGDGSPSL